LPYIKQNSQATCLYVAVEQWVVCLSSRVARTSDKSIQSFFSIIYFVYGTTVVVANITQLLGGNDINEKVG